jgi:crotonobetainyl-CoA:carnitine CoA-transferase CaiB-like acyl-CoA transferase
MVARLDYQGSGFKVPGNPIKLPSIKPRYKPPPTFGQHTDKILSQILGYTQDRIKALKQERVIY